MQIAHNKGRLEQFSDGVFAIAITLLALDLHVPHLVGHDIRGGLSEIALLLPNMITFILSFMTVAIFWVNHHQLTQEIKFIHRSVLWTNVLFLLFITLIPFGTNVASSNPTHPLAMMTYAFILFAGSVSFSVLRYFVHRGLGEKRVPMGRSLVGPIVYLCAIISAVIFVETSYFIFAIPPIFYFLPKGRKEGN